MQVIHILTSIWLISGIAVLAYLGRYFQQAHYVRKTLYEEQLRKYKEKVRSLEAINQRLGVVNAQFLELIEGFAGQLNIEEINCDPCLTEKLRNSIFPVIDDDNIYYHLEKIKTDYLKGYISDVDYDTRSAYLLSWLNKK